MQWRVTSFISKLIQLLCIAVLEPRESKTDQKYMLVVIEPNCASIGRTNCICMIILGNNFHIGIRCLTGTLEWRLVSTYIVLLVYDMGLFLMCVSLILSRCALMLRLVPISLSMRLFSLVNSAHFKSISFVLIHISHRCI